MKKLSILLLFAIPAIVTAQITISHADYQLAFQVGQAYKTYATETGSMVSVFVGSASSSSQIWDFSSLLGAHIGSSISVIPSDAPFYSQFPTTNVCLYGKAFIPGEDTTENWQYQHLATDKLTMLAVSDPTSVMMEYDPPAIQSVVPLSYGSTWVSERDSTYIAQNIWLIKETTAIIDAFGTMKLSSGDYPCLRLTFDYLGIFHGPLGIDTTRTRGYHWYSRNLAEFHIPTILEDQFNLTTLEISGLSWSIPLGASAIGEQIPVNSQPHLLPNFPNPFSQSTTLSYWIPGPGDVILTICDYVGKEVSTLVNNHRSSGSHEAKFDAAGLPDGLYFCRFQSGKYEETNKMVVKH